MSTEDTRGNTACWQSPRKSHTSEAAAERDGAWHPDARFLVARGKPPTDQVALRLLTAPEDEHAMITTAREAELGRVSPVRTVTELKERLEARHYDITGYRIAVEALLFDAQGRVLLQIRGSECRDEVGRLECIGGRAVEEDLIESLRHHVARRLGPEMQMVVDEMLEEQPIRFVERHGPEDWIVVSYLCRHVEGDPRIVDPSQTEALHWMTLTELYATADEQLSRATSRWRDVYRAQFRTRPYFSRAGTLA